MESKEEAATEEKPATAVEWEELSEEAMQDRRKCRRVPLAFPIEVFGFDRAGRLFSEITTTSNISEAGCKFQLKTQVERGDVVAIKLLSRRNETFPPSKAQLFRIVWADQQPEGWMAGAVQLQRETLWPMTFPPNKQPKASP